MALSTLDGLPQLCAEKESKDTAASTEYSVANIYSRLEQGRKQERCAQKGA
jgi:hypothetical protein